MEKKHLWIILFLILCFMGVKTHYIIQSHSNGFYTEQGGDAGHYLNIAKNIASHFTYADNDSNIPTESATWRPPGWPVLLSLFHFISDNLLFLIVLKSLMEMGLFFIAILILYRKKVVTGVAFTLLILLLLEPQYIKYSLTFLSESLTALLIFLASVLFAIKSPYDKYSVLFPVVSSFIILVHPGSVFFVGALYLFYSLLWLKRYPKKIILYGVLFVLMVSLWPVRNALTFHTAPYMTVSQGAALSKGWNEKVVTDFTNVDGDLADEGLNLKYISNDIQNSRQGAIEKSELYKKATKEFIRSSNFKELAAIAWVKLKSNFNPFPEKPKNTFIDRLAVPFRILYAFVFLQVLYLIFMRKFNFNTFKGKVALIVIAVLIGQVLMSIYIYTGLRFNAVYGMTLLFAFFVLNTEWILTKLKIRT